MVRLQCDEQLANGGSFKQMLNPWQAEPWKSRGAMELFIPSKRCLSDLLQPAGLGKCKPSGSLTEAPFLVGPPQHSLSCFVPSLPCPTAGGSPLPPALLCLFLSLQLRSCQWVTRIERSLLLHFVQPPLHTPKFQEPGCASKMWGSFWMSGYPYEEPMLCQNRLWG